MRRALAALAVLALAGCAPVPAATNTVTVFAAASLTESFGEIARAFEAENPGVTVLLSFGGSSGLATQIVEGAPADVFAAASEATMRTVAAATTPTVAESATFATNTLEIAVPAGNPGAVRSLADLANPDLAIALCAAEVPCGAASVDALDAASVTASVDTFEQDVKAVLTKIELGEVDAGLVYRTDVLTAGDAVEGTVIPGAQPSAYPIAALTDRPAAAQFVAFVLSDAGQRILAKAGFGAP